MPRLDADRMKVWRQIEELILSTHRAIDAELRREWAVPLAWFEVLRALRELGGVARPVQVADAMGVPPSSLSRRFDRLAEEGWIARHTEVDASDLRAVDVELTPSGRKLWREMNITYRRAVQQQLVGKLGDDDVDALRTLIERAG